MPRTIKISSGATLSGLAQQYNTTVGDLMSINPNIKDPNKIFAGASLNLPELAGTMEVGGVSATAEEKTLPNQKVDRLSMFGDLLKMVTQRAAKESVAKGGEALPEGMLKPEQMSGSSFANVLSTITKQKTSGIADIYESTISMLENTREQADKQLSTLISTGAIGELDNQSLQKLSDISEYPLDYLQSMRTVALREREQKKSASPDNTDRMDQVNSFLQDKVGADGKISAESYTDAYAQWHRLGGTFSNFKYAYPVDEWLGEWEYKDLPTIWQPKAESGDDKKITIESARKSMYAQLDKVIGSDGFVSPDDYAKAKAAWVRETGFLAEKFDEAMSIYRDPNNNNYKIEY